MQISAQLQNAKVLLQFLKVVNFKDDVNIVLSSNGMKLTVQESSVFQANAFLQKDVFRYFNFPPEAEHSNLEAGQKTMELYTNLTAKYASIYLYLLLQSKNLCSASNSRR